MEETLQALKKAVEGRDAMSPDNRNLSFQELMASGRISQEEVQVYLLLKILDRLEAISSRLDSIDNELWTRHNP